MLGLLHFRIAGVDQSVKPGEAVDIHRNVPHYFWNAGDEEVHTIQEFRPAFKIEDFFDTYFALARDGKLHEQGTTRQYAPSGSLDSGIR